MALNVDSIVDKNITQDLQGHTAEFKQVFNIFDLESKGVFGVKELHKILDTIGLKITLQDTRDTIRLMQGYGATSSIVSVNGGIDFPVFMAFVDRMSCRNRASTLLGFYNILADKKNNVTPIRMASFAQKLNIPLEIADAAIICENFDKDNINFSDFRKVVEDAMPNSGT